MISSSGSKRWFAAMALVAMAGTAACSSDDVTDVPDGLRPQAAIDDPSDVFDGTDNSTAYVCVVSPVAGTYTYDISGAGAGSNPGPTLMNDPATVNPGSCEAVATSGAGAGFFDADTVTADQTAAPGTVVLDSVIVEDAKFSHQGGTTTFIGSDFSKQGDPAEGLISNERATRITFFYSLVPDTGGGEGCTPGYWKQSQHFGSWTAPYTPNTQFSAVFENAFPGMTLLQVLGQGGGGLKALGRHTVAALLNGASADVDADMTAQEVINAFNAVFPGGNYSGLQGTLAGFNEQGCPLGRDEG